MSKLLTEYLIRVIRYGYFKLECCRKMREWLYIINYMLISTWYIWKRYLLINSGKVTSTLNGTIPVYT